MDYPVVLLHQDDIPAADVAEERALRHSTVPSTDAVNRRRCPSTLLPVVVVISVSRFALSVAVFWNKNGIILELS